MNLGPYLSEATHYQGDYQTVHTKDGWDQVGFDDSISLLVGGDFIVKGGSEVECKMVIIGDVEVEAGVIVRFDAHFGHHFDAQ